MDKNCNATAPTTNNKQSAPIGKLGMSVSLDQKPKHMQTQQNAQNNSLQINDNIASGEQQPGSQLPTAQATNNYYSQTAVSLLATNLQQQPQQPQIQQLQQSQRPQPSMQDQQQSDAPQSDQQPKEESLRHQFIQKNMSNINNKVITFVASKCIILITLNK